MFLMDAVLEGGAGDGGCALTEAFACARGTGGDVRGVGGTDGSPPPRHAGDNAVYWMQRLFEASQQQGGAAAATDFGAALHVCVGAAVARRGGARGVFRGRRRLVRPTGDREHVAEIDRGRHALVIERRLKIST